MAQQPADITAILAALGENLSGPIYIHFWLKDLPLAQQNGSSATPSQARPPHLQSPYPGNGAATPSGGYQLPPPPQVGSIDLSQIQPTSTGNVSLNDAIAKASALAKSRGLSNMTPAHPSESLRQHCYPANSTKICESQKDPTLNRETAHAHRNDHATGTILTETKGVMMLVEARTAVRDPFHQKDPDTAKQLHLRARKHRRKRSLSIATPLA